MGWFSKQRDELSPKVNWVHLTSEEELRKAIEESTEKPILLFKHSTRCSISMMALSGFESRWEGTDEEMTLYFLDLLRYRELSNEIERITGVMHQSPQAIVIKNKEVVYAASHSGIDARQILKLTR